MQPAIRVENLCKQYRLGTRKAQGYRTLRESLTEAVRAPWNRFSSLGRRGDAGAAAQESFWALKDISFEVQPGEVVGIIGRNGAGKSTLLKILSRIVEPTSGRAELRGRVGSLLEVGTGFHPELTGRENIYLNAAILGMARTEIRRKFDDIIAFAGIDQFLDTPVKRYSSGMYVRLAFAVAANIQPEILVIDEVLAVGDAEFQRKCLGKMSQVARSGNTVLFVSHNMAAIQNLCEKTIVLDRGQITYAGSTSRGVQKYMEKNVGSAGGDVDLRFHPSRRQDCIPLLKRIRLLDGAGNANDRFMSGDSITVEFTFDPVVRLTDNQFGIGVDDWTGTRIFSLATYLSACRLPPLHEECRIRCQIDELPLTPGRYTLSISSGTNHNTLLDALDSAVVFDVEPADFFGNGKIAGPGLGMILVRSHWEKVAGC